MFDRYHGPDFENTARGDRTEMRGLCVCLMLIGPLAQVPAAAQDCKVATIAGNPEWRPFSLASSDGQLSGAGIEIARAAFAGIDVRVKISEAEPWARALDSLETGRIDLIVSAYWAAERAERFLFTDAYADDPIAVFMKAAAPFPVNGIGDLAGRSGMAPLGSNYGDEITAFLRNDAKVSFNTSKEGMFRQLLTPRIDYAIMAQRNGERIVTRLGIAGAIVAAPKPLAVNKVYMMMSRKSPCATRLPELNAALAALAADGTIDRLIAAAESS
jgi:polar amino acid transport system substrate-binding protein